MREASYRFARALRANVLDQQWDEARDRIDQRQSAENPAADGETGAKADDQDGSRRGGGYSSARRTRPRIRITIETANGASFGFMNMCP